MVPDQTLELHSSSVKIHSAECLSCAAREQLFEAIGAAGTHTLAEFELCAIAATGSEHLAQVIAELGVLRLQFADAKNNTEEFALCDALQAKRAELAELMAEEDAAVQKARGLIHELQATNLLVNADEDLIRPADNFPSPDHIEV